MEAAKHHVFAVLTIGGKTLLEMTQHSEKVFANRESPSGRLDSVIMPYAFMTCQRVSPVIMPHIPEVTVSVCVCTHACPQQLYIVDQTQTAKAGEEPVAFLGVRGRWTKIIPATSASGAANQVMQGMGDTGR